MERECRYQAAIVDGDHILLIEHHEIASDRRYWVPPGGGIEPGESEEECVRREVAEETHLEVEVDRLLMTHEHNGSPYRRSKTYLCRAIGGMARPGVEPEHEHYTTYDISDVSWVSLTDPESWAHAIRDDAHTATFLHQVRAELGY